MKKRLVGEEEIRQHILAMIDDCKNNPTTVPRKRKKAKKDRVNCSLCDKKEYQGGLCLGHYRQKNKGG